MEKNSELKEKTIEELEEMKKNLKTEKENLTARNTKQWLKKYPKTPNKVVRTAPRLVSSVKKNRVVEVKKEESKVHGKAKEKIFSVKKIKQKPKEKINKTKTLFTKVKAKAPKNKMIRNTSTYGNTSIRKK